MEITIDLSGLKDIEKKLDYLPSGMIAKTIFQSVEDNFQEEGRPTAWEPRKDEGDGHPLLYDNGTLFHSLFYNIDRMSDGIDINFESGVDYSKFLDLGTEKMVARPFWMLQDPEDYDAIDEIIAKHLVD